MAAIAARPERGEALAGAQALFQGFERRHGSGGSHDRRPLVRRRDSALADSRAGPDPIVRRIDERLELRFPRLQRVDWNVRSNIEVGGCTVAPMDPELVPAAVIDQVKAAQASIMSGKLAVAIGQLPDGAFSCLFERVRETKPARAAHPAHGGVRVDAELANAALARVLGHERPEK